MVISTWQHNLKSQWGTQHIVLAFGHVYVGLSLLRKYFKTVNNICNGGH